jgi:hypothetical protein
VTDNDDKKPAKPVEKKAAPAPAAKPSAPAGSPARANAFLLPEAHAWSGAWKIAAGVGALGMAGAAAGFASNKERFAFSYLFAFECVLTVALGMIFFVLVQHLTSAGWSVTVRRTAEFFGAGIVAMIILFIPVYLSKTTLFPWLTPHHEEHAAVTHTTAALLQHPGTEHPAGEPKTGAEGAAGTAHPAARPAGESDPHEVAHAELMEKKKPYLNEGFFTGRAIFYLLAWAFLGWRLLKYSTDQDTTKDKSLTVAVQRFAPVATILFALTLTFAGFDWIMSLDPTWFSTIFGVYIFAGSTVSALAALILVTMAMRNSGLLQKEINVEHFHDIGKLMFGFLVFWAYIGFSQFMLIWYAALPEETTFFHHRWDEGPWKYVSLALVLLHFVVPFFLVISRNAKRKLSLLAFGAAWILAMHCVDMYWLVMPNFGQADFEFHWMDAACLLGVAGVYLAVVFWRFTKHPLIPTGDPRLPRAIYFENA